MTRQNYYGRRRHRQRRKIDAELVVQRVLAERREQPSLGTRKLHVLLQRDLKAAGVKLGRDRLFEVLREKGLLVKRYRSEFPATTDSTHYLPTFGNRFKGLEITRPHQAWVGDLTYVRTDEGYLYLSLLTDAYSRKIVGYHCADTLESTGCLEALQRALAGLPPQAKPIHHTDRGIQYCCHQYVNCLQSHGLEISMTEKNHCAENAMAERMNGILKAEYGVGRKFPTKALARRAVEQSVQLYNTRRPHTALGYRFPEEVHTLAV